MRPLAQRAVAGEVCYRPFSMRLIIVGLAFVVLAVALAEYARRHPTSPEAEGAAGARSALATPSATGTGEADVAEATADTAGRRAPAPEGELLETAPPPPLEVPSLEPVEALLRASTPAARSAEATRGKGDALAPLLQGRFVVRQLQALEGVAVAVLESDGLFGLVELRPGAPARALAATRTPVTAMAVGAGRIVWASGALVLRVDTASLGVSHVVHFRRAEVVSLAASGDVLLVALQPRGMDPFSEEPVGAVARLWPDGRVEALADAQARPHDVATDGRDVYWVAGYPSSLHRAALDGSSSARVAPRADGPLAFARGGLVFRVPGATGSELRIVERVGGRARRAVRADADWAATDGDSVYAVTTGLAPQLLVVEAGATEDAKGPEGGAQALEASPGAPDGRELVRLPGSVRGLAAGGGAVFVAVLGADGTSSVLTGRSGPPR